jgi:hypothetical protein
MKIERMEDIKRLLIETDIFLEEIMLGLKHEGETKNLHDQVNRADAEIQIWLKQLAELKLKIHNRAGELNEVYDKIEKLQESTPRFISIDEIQKAKDNLIEAIKSIEIQEGEIKK